MRYRPAKPYNCKSNRYLNGFMVDILKKKGQIFSRLDYIMKENFKCKYQKKKRKKKLKRAETILLLVTTWIALILFLVSPWSLPAMDQSI